MSTTEKPSDLVGSQAGLGGAVAAESGAELGELEDVRARGYWELVWLADPAYMNVADFLKREYLLRGLESFSRGHLEDAVELWEKALKVDPADEKTLGYLQRAREQQMRTREILGSGTDGAQ